jgi:hypothetical protein
MHREDDDDDDDDDDEGAQPGDPRGSSDLYLPGSVKRVTENPHDVNGH